MKKNFLIIITILTIMIPISVKAEGAMLLDGISPHSEITNPAYCTVISGDGTEIGSEIDCAGERFYVIGIQNNQVRLFAKYNLYVGFDIYKLDFSENRYNELKEEYFWTNTSINSRIAEEPEFSGYDMAVAGDDESHSILAAKQIAPYDGPKQSSKALSAYGGELGKPAYPQYGNVFSNTIVTPESLPAGTVSPIYGDGHYIDGTPNMNESILYGYGEYLYDNNIDVKNVDMMTIRELSDIVKNVTGNPIPLVDWYENSNPLEVKFGNQTLTTILVLGDLKTVISDKYKWLYSTTYWTRTLESYNGDYSSNYTYFVDTLGYVCSQNNCGSALGAGIRPIVVLEKNIIKFPIYTKVKGEGSIEVIDSSIPGELINFTLKADEKLKLNKLEVITASGQIIEFNENDITQEDEYTLSVKSKNFRMPSEAVTISAEWVNPYEKVKENPKTGITNYMLLFTPIIICLSLIYSIIKRKNIFKYNK